MLDRLLTAVLAASLLAAPALSRQRGGKPPDAPATGRGETTPAPKEPKPKPTEAPPIRGDLGQLGFDAPAPMLEAWRALVERDARLSFPPRAASLAHALLERTDLPAEQRAVAWVALGDVGAVDERLHMEELAHNGAGVERLAAILALGELGGGSDALLEALAEEHADDVAQCALVALLRIGKSGPRRRVEEIAHDTQHRQSVPAADLLVAFFDAPNSRPTPAARLLFALRWEAARQMGLVDGQAWPVIVERDLAARGDFLAEVVLRASPRVHRSGVRDHLLNALMESSGPGRLRGAVGGIPRELCELIHSGLWEPADDGEWSVLLDEVDQRGLEKLCPELLEAAAERPRTSLRARVLQARAGDGEAAAQVAHDLARRGAGDRALACLALADAGDVASRKLLGELHDDPDPPVAAAALVGQYRLASKKAIVEVQEILAHQDSPSHAPLVRALCAAVRDPAVSLVMESYLPQADESLRVEVALALSREGWLAARAVLRSELAHEPLRDPLHAAELVSVLRRHASPEDLDILHRLFPRDDLEGERALNVELALALTVLGDPAVQPLLHAAVWHCEFDTSLLAAGLLIETTGMQSLRQELDSPPPEARASDLRRVGFALGEWGGLNELEGLARALRYNSGAPALQGALLGFLATRTQ